jgi:hypothetical protein
MDRLTAASNFPRKEASKARKLTSENIWETPEKNNTWLSISVSAIVCVLKLQELQMFLSIIFTDSDNTKFNSKFRIVAIFF